jgi:hypothetical protein
VLDLHALARWASTPELAGEDRPADARTAAYAAAAKLNPPRMPSPNSIADYGRQIASLLLDGRRDLEAPPKDLPRCPIPELSDAEHIDTLAWYRSWHSRPSPRRAVYLTDWGIHRAAQALMVTGGPYRERLHDAIALLVAHELFHAAVDLAVTQLEAVLAVETGRPTALWRAYHEHVYGAAPGGGVEESLANAFSLRATDLGSQVRDAAEAWYATMPGGYAEYAAFLDASRFRRGLRELLVLALGGPYRSGARGKAAPVESLLQQALAIAHLRQVPVFLLVSNRARGTLLGTANGLRLTTRARDKYIRQARRAMRLIERAGPNEPMPPGLAAIPDRWACELEAYDGMVTTGRLAAHIADLDGRSAPPLATVQAQRARVADVAAAWRHFAEAAGSLRDRGSRNEALRDLAFEAWEAMPFQSESAGDDQIRAVARLA